MTEFRRRLRHHQARWREASWTSRFWEFGVQDPDGYDIGFGQPLDA
jgi:hypothetical protein